jgi:hypothetical protein
MGNPRCMHAWCRARHAWGNKWRSDWKSQYGHTKIWGFDDYDTNNFDGIPIHVTSNHSLISFYHASVIISYHISHVVIGEPLNRDRVRNERQAFSTRTANGAYGAPVV